MARLFIALFIGTALLGAIAVRPAAAATLAPPPAAPATSAQAVDDNDDTRVEVQLVVAGIAAFVVVGVGLAAYLARRRLGLVAPPPDQSAGGHH